VLNVDLRITLTNFVFGASSFPYHARTAADERVICIRKRYCYSFRRATRVVHRSVRVRGSRLEQRDGIDRRPGAPGTAIRRGAEPVQRVVRL